MMLAALVLLGLAALGVVYTLLAAWLVRRFAVRPDAREAAVEPVTLLKPLHGIEPRLAENLVTFRDQDWPAPVQMVAGVNEPSDRAAGVARPIADELRVAAPPLGANAKISNLANMMPAAAHDLLVLSDSDMAVPRDYLRRIAGALAEPGVDAVTCLYRGRGDAGFWSVLGAAGISYQFLPGVVVSRALGIGGVCMGSTIALRRATLERIGGFAAFVDTLADDHAIGAAVRRTGGCIAIPPIVLVHASAERSAANLVRHELRWAATIRSLDFAGHVGTILTFPLPLALLALPFAPLPALVAAAVALLARLHLARAVDRLCGARTAPLALLPARAILSFVVFVTSFAVRSVDWRGIRLRMADNGRVAREPESRST